MTCSKSPVPNSRRMSRSRTSGLQRHAGPGLDLGLQHLGVDSLHLGETNRVDRCRVGLHRPGAALLEGGVVGRTDGERRRGDRRQRAPLPRRSAPSSAGRRSRSDENVPSCGSIRMSVGFSDASDDTNVLLGQDVDHLRRHAEDVVDRFARRQRRADVDGDDDICTHRAGDVDREVVRQAAVDEQQLADLGRRDRARHRHAGAHRRWQLALPEDDRLAGDEIGRDRAIGNRQLVEVEVPGPQRQPAQHDLEADAGDRALLQRDAAPVEAGFDVEQRCAVVELAPDRLVLPRRLLLEQGSRRERGERLLHVDRRQAGRIGAADDRAHARARHAIDRHVQLLQDLDDPDVGGAAGAAAGKDEADLRSGRCRERERQRGDGNEDDSTHARVPYRRRCRW